MPLRTAALFCLILTVAGCVNADRLYDHPYGAPEATSLLGEPLWPMALDADTKATYERNLADAERAYTSDPHDELALIWLGRRTAYLGRYQEAITIYSEALRIFPFSPRLLRHRGHRFITTRQFARAEHDLTRASKLVAGRPDRVEPDGLPNRLNRPTSTTQTNIWYHLGLTQYVQGEFEEAAISYRRCFDLARNDDMRVAAAYWLSLSLFRVGDSDSARAALAFVRPEMEIIENDSYHQLLLLLRGEKTLDELPTTAETIDDATLGYGIGAWHQMQGREAQAQRIFEKIVTGGAWPAFGFIAAEAEVARSR